MSEIIKRITDHPDSVKHMVDMKRYQYSQMTIDEQSDHAEYQATISGKSATTTGNTWNKNLEQIQKTSGSFNGMSKLDEYTVWRFRFGDLQFIREMPHKRASRLLGVGLTQYGRLLQGKTYVIVTESWVADGGNIVVKQEYN